MAGESKPTAKTVRGRRQRQVERIEDWADARYSVVPPRAADDARLTLAHMRILILIGRVNTQLGWCQLSQTAVSEQLGVVRTTLSRAVGELVTWGYVAKRDQATTRSSLCHYRVLIDPAEDDEGVCFTENTPLKGGVSPTENTPSVASGKHPCAPQKTPLCSTEDTPVIENARGDQRSEITYPPTPSGDERGGDLDLRVDDELMQPAAAPSPFEGFAKGWTERAQAEIVLLLENPIAGHVASAFLKPIVGTHNPPAQADAVAYVRQLRHRLQPFGAHVLRELAGRMIETRGTRLPGTADIVAQAIEIKRRLEAEASRERIAGAHPNRVRHVIRADAVQWQSWMDHLTANDRLLDVRAALAAGAIVVTHKFPQTAAELISIGEEHGR